MCLSCVAYPRAALAQATPAPVANDCDRAAASDFDKQSLVAGVPFARIDPKVAIPACLEALAKDPDSPRLNFELGRAYDADKDFPEALKFFRKSAAANFALAQVNLGSLYFNGQGVDKDYAAAAEWDRLAADQGLAPAQAALGSLYRLGQGVARDGAEAGKWLRLAAAQGFAPAQNSLGALYANGEGVARDRAEAKKWYEAAAAQGFASARASLEALNAEESAGASEGAAAPAVRVKSDPNAPRYLAAPRSADYPPVKIVVKAPDSRVSSRIAATTIEISPLSSSFAMTGFAVNKGECPVYIQDPTALLRGYSAAQTGEAGKSDPQRQSDMEKISLIRPPFDPPVSAGPGQYMTFYVDPSACPIREVEALVNGYEWVWAPQ